MSIQLKDFNIIIPRAIVDSLYPGGSLILIEEKKIPEYFYDENLIRFGAADTLEIGNIIEEWTARGLRDVRKRKGQRTWIDLCLVHSEEGLTLPCKWIKIEKDRAEYIG